MQYILELLPPIQLPSKEEMAEQMKNLVPGEQLMRELNEMLDARPLAAL